MEKVDLKKQASNLAHRGIAAVEGNDADDMKFIRLEILELLSDLHSSDHSAWIFGLTKVANTIQVALEKMPSGRSAVPRTMSIAKTCPADFSIQSRAQRKN